MSASLWDRSWVQQTVAEMDIEMEIVMVIQLDSQEVIHSGELMELTLDQYLKEELLEDRLVRHLAVQ